GLGQGELPFEAVEARQDEPAEREVRVAARVARLELVALTCPSYLSYARLLPSAWAASTVSWGFDNREAALRIASPFRGREDVSPNAELNERFERWQSAHSKRAHSERQRSVEEAVSMSGSGRGERRRQPARIA